MKEWRERDGLEILKKKSLRILFPQVSQVEKSLHCQVIYRFVVFSSMFKVPCNLVLQCSLWTSSFSDETC